MSEKYRLFFHFLGPAEELIDSDSKSAETRARCPCFYFQLFSCLCGLQFIAGPNTKK